MHPLRLIAQELRMLARALPARIVLLLTAGLGGLGVNAIEYSNRMMLRVMVDTAAVPALGSAQYAALGGSVFFGMLALLTLSRDHRARTSALLDASHRYRRIVLARIVALLAWVVVAVVVSFSVAWICHLLVSSASYDLGMYLFLYVVVTLPALGFAVLICAGLYLATESLDVAYLTFGVLYTAGFAARSYLLRWVQTSLSVVSDFGGLSPVAKFAVYNRLLWIWIALGFLLVGLLLQRRSGCGLVESMARNARGGRVPALLGITIGIAVLLVAREPYVFPADSAGARDLTMVETVKLEAVDSRVTLRPESHGLDVVARYMFQKEPGPQEIVFVTNAGLTIKSVTVDGRGSRWYRLPGTDRVRVELPPGERAEVAFVYGGTIRQASAGSFAGYIGPESVYLLENSHWLFRPLAPAAGRIAVTGNVTAPANLTVVTPGRTVSVRDTDTHRTITYEASTQTLNVGLFAADYAVERFSAGALQVELYICPRHLEAARAHDYGEHLRRILEFYQGQLGPYPYPEWPIKVVEVPLYKAGGHSSLNVITLAEYLVNRKPVVTPTDEIRYLAHTLKLFAHELAHQWWGTAVHVEERGSWTSEGLAEYAMYRFIAEHYPENASNHMVQSWKAASDGVRRNYFARHPEVLLSMRPEFARRQVDTRTMVEAYNGIPLRLLQAETHVGLETFRDQLAGVYRKHRGSTLRVEDFVTDLGLPPEAWAVE